jgi:uncharacterized protein
MSWWTPSSRVPAACMPSSDSVSVLVVYALPDAQHCVAVHAPMGATVADAIALSGLSRQFPAITQRELCCAIFNRVVPPSQVLASGDRVEILRPLRIDPKEQRRQEAARAKAAKTRRR